MGPSVAHHSVPVDPHQPRRTTCRSVRPAACWNVSNEEAIAFGVDRVGDEDEIGTMIVRWPGHSSR